MCVFLGLLDVFQEEVHLYGEEISVDATEKAPEELEVSAKNESFVTPSSSDLGKMPVRDGRRRILRFEWQKKCQGD